MPKNETEKKVLPDGTILTEARQHIIRTGYDHYWRFHDKPKNWALFGCPVCKSLIKHPD